MQACAYANTILPYITPNLAGLDAVVAEEFANRPSTKNAVYQIFKFVLEYRKYLVVLEPRFRENKVIERLIAVIVVWSAVTHPRCSSFSLSPCLNPAARGCWCNILNT